MSQQATYTLEFIRGADNDWMFGLGQQGQFRYATISAAAAGAPCVITAPSHGVPDGWVFTIEGARGMTALNRDGIYVAKRLNENALELNDLNTTNSQPYIAGSGVLRYEAPMDLSDVASAKIALRAGVGAEAVLLELTTEPDGGLTLDVERSALLVKTTAEQSVELAAESGVWDLELSLADGTVIKPFRLSRFVVLPESTS